MGQQSVQKQNYSNENFDFCTGGFYGLLNGGIELFLSFESYPLKMSDQYSESDDDINEFVASDDTEEFSNEEYEDYEDSEDDRLNRILNSESSNSDSEYDSEESEIEEEIIELPKKPRKPKAVKVEPPSEEQSLKRTAEDSGINDKDDSNAKKSCIEENPSTSELKAEIPSTSSELLGTDNSSTGELKKEDNNLGTETENPSTSELVPENALTTSELGTGPSSSTVELNKEFAGPPEIMVPQETTNPENPLTTSEMVPETLTSEELKTKNDPSLSELGVGNHLTPELGPGNHLTSSLGTENFSKPRLEMENPNWQSKKKSF